MIITLTPNPSLDRTYVADTILPGGVNRAHETHVDAGGKGINVTRALTRNGFASVAVFPSGGFDGGRLVSALLDRSVPARPVEVPGETRSNITLVDGLGVTTKINAPGEKVTEESVAELTAALVAELDAAAARGEEPIVVGAGSVPDGAGDDFYVRVTHAVTARGAKMVVDASGAPFLHAVRAGGLALVKPNEDELAEVVGRPLSTVGEIVDAATEVMARGTEQVLVSLGAHGALLVAPDGVWWAGGPALVPRSTVGAGDTTLAGYLGAVVSGATGPQALRQAVAWGRAAVLLPGSAVPAPEDIDLAEVESVHNPIRSTPLKEL